MFGHILHFLATHRITSNMKKIYAFFPFLIQNLSNSNAVYNVSFSDTTIFRIPIIAKSIQGLKPFFNRNRSYSYDPSLSWQKSIWVPSNKKFVFSDGCGSIPGGSLICIRFNWHMIRYPYQFPYQPLATRNTRALFLLHAKSSCLLSKNKFTSSDIPLHRL